MNDYSNQSVSQVFAKGMTKTSGQELTILVPASFIEQVRALVAAGEIIVDEGIDDYWKENHENEVAEYNGKSVAVREFIQKIGGGK